MASCCERAFFALYYLRLTGGETALPSRQITGWNRYSAVPRLQLAAQAEGLVSTLAGDFSGATVSDIFLVGARPDGTFSLRHLRENMLVPG